MKIQITAFAGETPKRAPHLLANEQATLAKDARLTDGSLRPFNTMLDVQALNATPKTLYQYRDGGNVYWFDWTQMVDVIPSPIADDPNNRVYMTGTVNGARFTDSALALSGGTDYPVNDRQLGMPEPVSAPLAAVTGAADDGAEATDGETRQYTYTWIDENGREGPPSLPSAAVEVLPGQQVQLTVDASPGAVDLNITHYRVYTSTAAGTWQLCTQVNHGGTVATDIPVGQITVTDQTPLDQRGELLKTIGWLAPPVAMKGMVVMPGGIAVGYFGKELLFSEPYHLYAWPPEYRLTLDYEIRALAVAGNSVIIGTEGKPYVAFGTEPSSMTLEQLDSAHACISDRSMVDMGDKALYASPDGLVQIIEGQARLLTRTIINPDDWRSRFQPETIHACFHDDKYFGFYGTSASGGGFILDTTDGTFTELSQYADACYRDLQDDTLYLGIGNSIKAWDKGATLTPYQWRSKVFRDGVISYNSARVEAESYNDLTLRVYRDGSLIYDEAVTSADGFRLPAGDGSAWQFELTGTDTVLILSVATSMDEL